MLVAGVDELISKRAISDFMARKLKDSERVKRFTDRQLDERIRKLGLRFHTRPRHAQKMCVLLGWKYARYLFLLGMGGGKTWIALNLYHNRARLGLCRRLLVVVPNVVNLGEWADQAEQHTPDLRVCPINMKRTEERERAFFSEDNDVVVITYQGLSVMLCDKVPGRKKGKLVPNRALVGRTIKTFGMLVLDESMAVSNHQSLQFRVARVLGIGIKYLYAMTGTPFNEPGDLWSQFYLVDGGHALGETLGLYREAFFRKVETYWSVEWHFRKRLSDQLHRRLRHCSIRMREEDCQDLPESVGGLKAERFMALASEMPAAQRPYYKALEKELISIEHGRVKVIEQAYHRMRMITAGWMGAVDEDGERVELVFKHNPKLESVLAKLAEIGDEQCIVVHWYNMSGSIITKRLAKDGFSYSHVYGKTPDGQKEKMIRDFKKGNHQILVGSSAIALGLNLQHCKYMIFFESPDAPDLRAQIEARIARGDGAPGPRYYYDAVMRGTKDETVLQSIKAGRRTMDVVVDQR